MLSPAYVVFSLSIVSYISEICFCEDLSRKLLDSIRNAEQAQRGLATVFRVRATRVGDARNPALTGTDTVVFCIRTSSLKAEENVFIASTALRHPEGDKFVEFMAKFEGRTFGGGGTNFTAVIPKEITDMAEDDRWAKAIEIDRKSLNRNPMALPFLTLGSIYVMQTDFKSVHSSFVTCSISYADESGLVSVWENPKEGVVIEMKLAKESSNLPIQACFYLRPKNAKRLLKGDKLGELVPQLSIVRLPRRVLS